MLNPEYITKKTRQELDALIDLIVKVHDLEGRLEFAGEIKQWLDNVIFTEDELDLCIVEEISEGSHLVFAFDSDEQFIDWYNESFPHSEEEEEGENAEGWRLDGELNADYYLYVRRDNFTLAQCDSYKGSKYPHLLDKG
jgi:hypothetical protein